MAGTVISPTTTSQSPSPSYVNSFRISAVVDRLLTHVGGGSTSDKTEFFNLCLSLARGIDYAIATNEIHVRAPDLPYLLKQVCQRRDDTVLRAAIMVLMISIKSACRNGWFDEKDSEELHILSREIASSFCSVGDMNSGENTFHHSISVITSRFYPSMKMGRILAFVEATQGYGTFVNDFHITKNTISSDDKIYLFVAQTDNTETSSCIISPQQVNFLLNGRAVERRTCVDKDPGPQMPTLVTHMLKYGTNLLQAVGQFYGKYIIVVAFMNMVPVPTCSLLDYVPSAASTAPDSDNDIVEGPSRISLNCPISFKRIKIPIKGQLCKHLQCFDFDNYLGINSVRPSWRCPHCSQSVCFQDIRVHQNIVKILKEVGGNVSHVKIFSDASWEAVTEIDDHHSDNPSLHQESTNSMKPDILDLTEGDNDSNSHKQPSPTQIQDQISNISNEYVTRNPIVVQALPVQTSAGMVSDSRQNQYSRFPVHMASALPSHNMGSQKHDRSVQQFDSYSAPLQESSDYRYTSALSPIFLNSHQNQSLNQRISTPAQVSPQVHQGTTTGLGTNQQAYYRSSAVAQQANQIRSRAPSVQTFGSSVTKDPAPRVLEGSGEQNRRRMRGSLSGRDYSEALNQLIIHPTQPVQAARPPILNAPRPALPPHLQILMANNRNAHTSKDGARVLPEK